MINPIINGIVVAIFGFIIGGVLSFSMLLRGYSREVLRRRAHKKLEGEEKKWTLRSFIREAKARAEEGRRGAKSMPRSAKLATVAFYGLIIVMIIIVKYSPLEMSWLVLIISVLIGHQAVDRLFGFAREGKIHAKGKSAFDILPEERQEK